jgi:hypothetical protein
MSPPGRPKGEYRRARPEGSPVDPRSHRRLPALLMLLGALTAQAAADRPLSGTAGELLVGTPPPAGAYDAEMCVTVAARATNCGPVRVDIGEGGWALVRFADMAYRLQVHADQLGVSLFHGTMQIDGFFARYRWNGQNLQFADPEKNTRYELKLGTRRFDAP